MSKADHDNFGASWQASQQLHRELEALTRRSKQLTDKLSTLLQVTDYELPANRLYVARLQHKVADDQQAADLQPLDRRIASRDWLIDHLVYALYALTPAEIVVVER